MKECVECYDDDATWINESGNPICKNCMEEKIKGEKNED